MDAACIQMTYMDTDNKYNLLWEKVQLQYDVKQWRLRSSIPDKMLSICNSILLSLYGLRYSKEMKLLLDFIVMKMMYTDTEKDIICQA